MTSVNLISLTHVVDVMLGFKTRAAEWKAADKSAGPRALRFFNEQQY